MMEVLCFFAIAACLVAPITGVTSHQCQTEGMCIDQCTDTPRDCTEIRDRGQSKSGVYSIQPSTYLEPFYVHCDMETDGGGWTVFQSRLDGSVGFYRGWADYREGFGNVNTEHWLGNEKLFYLTAQGTYELRIEMSDFEGESRYAVYDYFRIGDEENLYKLFLGSYTGNAGDGLGSIHHRGSSFSTKDADHDHVSESNCAVQYKGGWWYGTCHSINLNGLYLGGTTESYADGVVGFRGNHYSLKTAQMKIRRLN